MYLIFRNKKKVVKLELFDVEPKEVVDKIISYAVTDQSQTKDK